MDFYLLVEDNDIDIYINEAVMKYCGIDDFRTFKSIREAWDFLKNADWPKVIALVSLTTLLGTDWKLSGLLKKPEEFKGELEIYVLSSSFRMDIGELYMYTEFKGFIEKPLTVEKATLIISEK